MKIPKSDHVCNLESSQIVLTLIETFESTLVNPTSQVKIWLEAAMHYGPILGDMWSESFSEFFLFSLKDLLAQEKMNLRFMKLDLQPINTHNFWIVGPILDIQGAKLVRIQFPIDLYNF